MYSVVLVDGNNLAHRVKHVLNLSHMGQDVSVLYGVLRSLCSMYKKWEPYRFIVCFDHGYPIQRRKLVPTYKQARTRDEGWELTQTQITKLYDWLPRFGIFTSKVEGYEADDLLAAHCKDLTPLLQHSKVLVVSGDKDLYQLVGPAVDVCNPNINHSDLHINLSNFENYVGIPKESYLLYRALVGDKSDEVPGVEGIGPAKAKAMLARFPTIEKLHRAYTLGQLASSGNLIAKAGGMKVIYNTLNCISLNKFTPTREQLLAGTKFNTSTVKWKELNDELIDLGFVTLVHDDRFREMVIAFNNRHGVVGISTPRSAPFILDFSRKKDAA